MGNLVLAVVRNNEGNNHTALFPLKEDMNVILGKYVNFIIKVGDKYCVFLLSYMYKIVEVKKIHKTIT